MSMQVCRVFCEAQNARITCVVLDQPRNVIWVAAEHGDIRVLPLSDGNKSTLKGHKGHVTGMTFLDGMNVVVSASVDGNCILWDAERLVILQVLSVHAAIRCLAWNQKQRILGMGQVPAMQFYTVEAEEVLAFRRIKQREINNSATPTAVWLKGDDSRFVGSRKLSVTLARRDANKPDHDIIQAPLTSPITPELQAPGYGHRDAVTAICITDTGLVMSASLDKCLCIFDVNRYQETYRHIRNAHSQGIISVAHDAVNNWFVTGGFDGKVKVWSADAKPLEEFCGVSDDVAHVAYLPFTHSYWQVCRSGRINAFDARAPAKVTELVEDCHTVAGESVDRLWVPPHSDSMFASTEDRKIIQYRYNHHGAHRRFIGHQGWAEAIVLARVPAGRDCSRHAQTQALQSQDSIQPVAQKVSQRRKWLDRLKKHEVTAAATAAIAAEPACRNMTPGAAMRPCAILALQEESKHRNSAVDESAALQTAMAADAHLLGRHKTPKSPAKAAKEGAATGPRGNAPGVTPCVLTSPRLAHAYESGKQDFHEEGSHLVAQVATHLHSVQPAVVEVDPDQVNEYIFTACASGVVHQWAQDKQTQCDRFEIVETHVVDSSHVFALAYCEEPNIVLAAGLGGFIKAIPLEARRPGGSQAGQPDCLYGHTQQVAALAVLKNYVLASAGHDQEIRFWDLHTMQEIEAGRKVEAHQAPVSGLSYCAERDELASSALENVAKVWDVRSPHASRLVFQVEARGEIAQFVWVPWRSLWCSFSGDGVASLWSTEGEAVFQFNYNGGLVQTALVDSESRVVLAAMQDCVIRVFDLEDPVPKARYQGHRELVTGIIKLESVGGYASCGWDKSLCLWQGHAVGESLANAHKRLLKVHDPFHDSTGVRRARGKRTSNPSNEPAAPMAFLERMDTASLYKQMVPEVKLLKTTQKLNDKLEQLDAELLGNLSVPIV
eukprot:jgi/Ulvmu1/8928/UM005_0019.1